MIILSVLHKLNIGTDTTKCLQLKLAPCSVYVKPGPQPRLICVAYKAITGHGHAIASWPPNDSEGMVVVLAVVVAGDDDNDGDDYNDDDDGDDDDNDDNDDDLAVSLLRC